jgi:hypothetical protein
MIDFSNFTTESLIGLDYNITKDYFGIFMIHGLAVNILHLLFITYLVIRLTSIIITIIDNDLWGLMPWNDEYWSNENGGDVLAEMLIFIIGEIFAGLLIVGILPVILSGLVWIWPLWLFIGSIILLKKGKSIYNYLYPVLKKKFTWQSKAKEAPDMLKEDQNIINYRNSLTN